MIVLLTPTGNRKPQLTYLVEWMQQQTTTRQILWVVVDDGLPITSDVVRANFRPFWQIVKLFPRPVWQPGQNTQARNMKLGLEYIQTLQNVEAVFVIEDDDYYSPDYIDRMLPYFKKGDLIGQDNTVYYNVLTRRYYYNHNKRHASLFQTAFKPTLIPVLLKILKNDLLYIDMALWRTAGLKKYLYSGVQLSIGIKGLSGRSGIGIGHRKMLPQSDKDGTELKKLLGENAKFYEPYFNQK